MKVQKLLIGIIALFLGFTTIAQGAAEFTPSGKSTGKIFFNYHYDMTDGEKRESSFELRRAYLGYNYQFAKGFKASVTLDVGKNDAGSDYTVFLKKAQLEWKMSPVVKLTFGMIGLEQFSDQEKFWGYRYIMKSFADEHGFGASADLGIKAKFKINDKFYANAFIVNGEGHRKVQDEDGKQKFGADLVYVNNGLMAKLYVDANTTTVVGEGESEEDVTVSALAAFVGYKFSNQFRLGAEYNQLLNGTKHSVAADNHDMNGWSFYSTYAFNKKVEVFGRYDCLTSNTLEGETEKWNLSKNGSTLTAGVQYAPVNGVKMALNYQGFIKKESASENNSMVYVNFEFKF